MVRGLLSIRRPTGRRVAAVVVLVLGAGVADAAVLIFGELHDQPDQQRQVADEVRRRAEAGTLAAVVLEMAERGRDTRTLRADADEARVREALGWRGWPWEPYAAIVMHAVRAGVPVIGGNLPRETMRDAMRDDTLDARVAPPVLDRLARAVRDGHCGLLPQSQEAGMVRIQIARDRALAATVAEAHARAAPGHDVLLLAGAQHASRDRGVPLHLPADLPVQVVLFGTPAVGLQGDDWRAYDPTPQPDPCDALREQLRRRVTTP